LNDYKRHNVFFDFIFNIQKRLLMEHFTSSTADGVLDEIQRLREDKRRLQDYLDRIFGISSAIIYILDANGHFTFVNRAVEDILNFSTEELIGKHFSFILPPEEYERVSREVVLPRIAGQVTGDDPPKLFDERRTGARRTRNMEVRLMTRRPQDYCVMMGDVTGIVEVEGAYSLNDTPATTPRKDVFLGSQGVIFDITKYKKAESERLELHKHIFQIQKNDAVAKLAGRVAHDLNNKLGSIIGTAEVLRQEIERENGSRETMLACIDTLLLASKHAAEVSEKLTKFGRKGESAFVPLNVHDILNNVMGIAKSIAGGNIGVRTMLTAKNPTITGSETMLQNALFNLVVNAFDAMKQGGGTLTVETADVSPERAAKSPHSAQLKRGSYLQISVRDTGIGMDDDVKSKLFDPFFTTHAEKGLGLGLVSFRECVRSHGGLIEIHSEPGKGARFDIYLPRPE